MWVISQGIRWLVRCFGMDFDDSVADAGPVQGLRDARSALRMTPTVLPIALAARCASLGCR